MPKFEIGHKVNNGRVPWNKGRKGVQIPWNKGLKLPGTGFQVGHKIWLGKKRNPPSEETKSKISKKLTGVRQPWHEGEKSNLWRGGTSTELARIKSSLKYREWRTSVFERDDYTCVFCEVRGGALEADHIKPKSIYRELMFDIENGRTLCKPCHRKTDTYGVKAIRNYAKT